MFLISVSGVGRTGGLVVVAIKGLNRFKYDSCGFLCLIELSSKMCTAWVVLEYKCFLIT